MRVQYASRAFFFVNFNGKHRDKFKKIILQTEYLKVLIQSPCFWREHKNFFLSPSGKNNFHYKQKT